MNLYKAGSVFSLFLLVLVCVSLSSFRKPVTYAPFDFQEFMRHYALGDSIKSNLDNRTVLVEFWASWCAPCRVKNAELTALYNNALQVDSLDIEIISVSLDSDSIRWRKAIRNDDLPWSVQLREKDGYKSAYLKSIDVQSLPQNVLINTEGKMVARNLKTPVIRAYLEHKY